VETDEDKMVTLTTIEGGLRILSLFDETEETVEFSTIVPGGQALTLRSRGRLTELDLPDGTYEICDVDLYSEVGVSLDELGDTRAGRSIIRLEGEGLDGCKEIVFNDTDHFGTPEDPLYFSNPVLRFDESIGVGANVLELEDEDAKSIDEQYYMTMGPAGSQSIILDDDIDNACDVSSGRSFAKWRGQVYLHDPRFVILENTPHNPLPDGGGEIAMNLQASLNRSDYLAHGDKYWGPKCSSAPRSFLNEESCFLSSSPHECSQDDSGVVCGSPNEVANIPELGGTIKMGAFISPIHVDQKDSLRDQRGIVWANMVLNDNNGQLRQKIAWALSELLVISSEQIGGSKEKFASEIWLHYYDIFIRHAFGNYKDVLKEVSYSALMGEMLSFIDGESTAYYWERKETVQYADENYAREIMQLFTMGMVKLHTNGTQVVNGDGNPERTYTNDDIQEYARAWTGFEEEEHRGNLEQVNGNYLDPMRIDSDKRDVFPKMGLNGIYVGDHYPLCSDLPSQHFLSAGAKYRLLGRKSTPDLQEDPEEWRTDENATIVDLLESSQLYSALCEAKDGQCTFPSMVELSNALDCDGMECEVDTLRSVHVTEGIFYEYIRPPCAHQAYFSNAKVVAEQRGRRYMCADPRTETATVACCDGISDTNPWDEAKYYGERTLLSTAQNRCENLDPVGEVCDGSDWLGKWCEGSECEENIFYWTNDDCNLFAKISTDGKVAIVHGAVDIHDRKEPKHKVESDSKTFFRVNWDGDYEEVMNCGDHNETLCSPTDDGACLCAISVTEEHVFQEIPSKEDLQSELFIGAFESSLNTPSSANGGVSVHNGSEGDMSMNTVFEFIDENGIRQLRKNMKSTVNIVGSSLSFRNPNSLFNIADPEVRDAQYETDATLDHYLFHSNTPTFLAIMFAQRFGISNPSSRYIESTGQAFRTGRFVHQGVTFGTGKYGDLAATFAAVLLHPEARNEVLDADPTHGSFKEPLLNIIGMMRSLAFQLESDKAWVEMDSEISASIGQMVHKIPTVFSFFMPDFQPAGPIEDAGLVAPEAQIRAGNRIISHVNGLVSLIKNGMNACHGGFGGAYNAGHTCNLETGEIQVGSIGHLAYSSSTDDARATIDELATLMTSGRLSPENRDIVEEMMTEQDEQKVLKAMMMIATSPEFHTTNIVRKAGPSVSSRVSSQQQETPRPYKALVHIQLAGGCDSYNLLVPHSCSGTNPAGQTVLEQYLQERGDIALQEEDRTRIIDVEGQPCEQFAIHKDLPTVERLYKSGELAFFANAGALEAVLNKDNYRKKTVRTNLFAHNEMQKEGQKLDPQSEVPGTGTLGRMSDILLSKGHKLQTFVIENVYDSTNGMLVEPPIVVPERGDPDGFAPGWDVDDSFNLRNYTKDMNSDTASSIFGETWSTKLENAIENTDFFLDALDEMAPITRDFDTEKRHYGDRLESVAKVILTHEARESERDVIFARLSNWDMHHEVTESLSENFQSLDQALEAFEMEMKDHGMWNDVLIVINSEFGRTLTPNSSGGTDHAWGGHAMILGGAVNGGQIHGQYPSDLTTDGELNLGRGRIIPQLSWEATFAAPLEFMGIDSEEEMDYCMPNRHANGVPLLTMEQVLK